MSRSLLMNSGSVESLNILTRCGTSPCAFKIACTEPKLIPTASAIARPVQCVASPGGTPPKPRTTCLDRRSYGRHRRPQPGVPFVVSELLVYCVGALHDYAAQG